MVVRNNMDINQLSRTDLEENGITYYWADAENQRNGYEFEGLNLVTTPPSIP